MRSDALWDSRASSSTTMCRIRDRFEQESNFLSLRRLGAHCEAVCKGVMNFSRLSSPLHPLLAFTDQPDPLSRNSSPESVAALQQGLGCPPLLVQGAKRPKESMSFTIFSSLADSWSTISNTRLLCLLGLFFPDSPQEPRIGISMFSFMSHRNTVSPRLARSEALGSMPVAAVSVLKAPTPRLKG